MSTVLIPQIDQVALDEGLTQAELRQARHHEAINRRQVCGWRSLAAAVVCGGIQRALGGPRGDSQHGQDTLEGARLFVMSEWASYLFDMLDMDPQLVAEARQAWSEQWQQESVEQREALPASLLSEDGRAEERTAAIWGK